MPGPETTTLTPDEERRRALSRRLVPHVKEFCEAFLGERPLEPCYRTSSRV